MKKNIQILETTQTRKIIEVELPIYKIHCLDSADIHTKINEDLSAIHITKTHYGDFEIEFDEQYRFDGSEKEYHLGTGVYSSSEETFYTILNEIKNKLQDI
jgi:hypothetical protein